MRRWPIASVTGLGALAAFGASAAPASALTPTRTAWWNEAPLGLVVSPSPVQPDQLMVAEGTAAPQAVAAVYYAVAPASGGGGAVSEVSATLRLPLDTGSSVGTPAIEACPIEPAAAGWHKGGAQTGSPPADDCADGKGVAGQLSSDGSSVLFSLTPAQQQAGSPGVFDLELVPASQTPFQTVFDPPGDSDFTVTAPPAPTPGTSAAGGASAPSGSSAPAGSDQGSGAPAGPDTSGSTSGPAGSSPDFGSGDLSSTPALAAPSLPSASSAPAGAGTSGGGTGTSGGVSRVAAGALRPTASSGGSSSGGLLGGRREQLLGVWLLVDAGLVLYLFGSDLERAPRLLGSVAARRGAARAEAEPDEGAARMEVRGIGRFARPRAEPARRLY